MTAQRLRSGADGRRPPVYLGIFFMGDRKCVYRHINTNTKIYTMFQGVNAPNGGQTIASKRQDPTCPTNDIVLA